MSWFSAHALENFKVAFSSFAGKPVSYLEIGVYTGNSSAWVLRNILTHPDARLVGIDPWEFSLAPRGRFPDTEEGKEAWGTMLANLAKIREESAGRVEWIRGYSQNVLRGDRWKDHSFDMVYIDGHHTTLCVLRDWALTWPLLKPGGVMVFDDYGIRTSPELRVAIDVILAGLGDQNQRRRSWRKRDSKCELLFKNYQVGIRKLRD